jgi:hypothetical protein
MLLGWQAQLIRDAMEMLGSPGRAPLLLRGPGSAATAASKAAIAVATKTDPAMPALAGRRIAGVRAGATAGEPAGRPRPVFLAPRR